MKITSTFLGITLKESLFKELFNSLKKYLKENNLEKSIEIQNSNSIHITLYYLDANLNKIILKNIKSDLLVLNKKNISVFIDSVKFFKRNQSDYICYLSPFKKDILEDINLSLKQKYKSKAMDNNYQYIPHITIFKINNFLDYKSHKKNILKIIKKFISEINKTNFYDSFNLYAVNSNKSPEEQKIIA
jgi:2'-5' RNA ligase